MFATGRVRRAPLAAVPGLVLLARRRRRLRLPRALGTALAAAVPIVVAASLPRGRARHVVLWSAQMWAYKIAFEAPYDRPELLRRRLRVERALAMDRRLGRGLTPTERLQLRLRDPDRVSPLDRALTAVYLLWEAEPHLAMCLVLLRRPERFGALAARQAATFDLTLVGYWLAPSAPPWWAAGKAGELNPRVQRVPARVIRDLRGEPLDQDDAQGANPWAAMPSDHFASALAAGLALCEVHPAAGAAGLCYAGALGGALVYLGEHYVADLLAGAALALGVAMAERPLRPLGRRLDELWRRIEP
jgi:membrane-associated phospholipid phosphatase